MSDDRSVDDDLVYLSLLDFLKQSLKSRAVERVEFLLEAVFGAYPGVDGTAKFLHASSFAGPVSPKKRGPDHDVPVMCFAMTESEAHVRPSIR